MTRASRSLRGAHLDGAPVSLTLEGSRPEEPKEREGEARLTRRIAKNNWLKGRISLASVWLLLIAELFGSLLLFQRTATTMHIVCGNAPRFAPREWQELRFIHILASVIVAALFASPATAQEKDLSAAEIAKLVQNPLSDAIIVPMANDANFGVGPWRQPADYLQIQPVVPFHINDHWNLITRTTIPIMSQARFSSLQGRESGIGDIVPRNGSYVSTSLFCFRNSGA
jgi:hypothetical protein